MAEKIAHISYDDDGVYICGGEDSEDCVNVHEVMYERDPKRYDQDMDDGNMIFQTEVTIEILRKGGYTQVVDTESDFEGTVDEYIKFCEENSEDMF